MSCLLDHFSHYYQDTTLQCTVIGLDIRWVWVCLNLKYIPYSGKSNRPYYIFLPYSRYDKIKITKIEFLIIHKVCTLKNNTNLNSIFCLIKSSEIIFLPTFYLTKEFEKISIFENMTAGFLMRCQNLLRQINPEIMHFQAWKRFSQILPSNTYFSH